MKFIMNGKLPRWPVGGLAAIATAIGGSLGLAAAAKADERQIGRGRPSTPASAKSREAGHEVEDFSARTVSLALGTIAVSYAILIGGIFFMVGHLSHGDAARYSKYTAQQTKTVEIPLPHLEVHPLAIYDAYRTHQLHRIGHYRKLGGGYARIPVDRAMQLMRGRSLDAGLNQPAGNRQP
jgi:hypothetical protein